MKKSKIPYLFFIFFGVIFIVDGIFIYVAKKSWTGLVTEDGYEKGLKYNQTLELVEKQKDLGWVSEIKRDGKMVSFYLWDKNNRVIRNAKVMANVTRPVVDGMDFEVVLEFDSKIAAYQAEIDFPLKGQWDIEVIAEVGDVVYQELKRVVY